MVSIEGVDYSLARPSIAGLKAADKQFVVRYITTPGPNRKGISQAEYNALHAVGIAVVAVYEGAANDMRKGHAQGVTDAKAAQASLKAIDGLGDNLPVYFACDWDATPAEQTAINAYLDGAASVIGRERVGIYGGYYPVKRAKAAGKATWLWQTYAWSGGQILDGIHLYQYKNNVRLAGGTVDLCRALKSNYGQKNVVADAPAPKPVPAPVEAPKPTPKPVDDSADVKAENADFDPTNFNGVYYFKGAGSSDVFVYDPESGKKRHVTAPEWSIIKGYGHNVVYTISQSDADSIPA